ncbi:MAG: hypothetical protein FWH11_02275 [Micrococcales bacterium]|nr:hypothetical protein [Micrococcales bacterium]
MLVGFVSYFPITMFIINPLLALALVWALQLPDKGFITGAGLQFWVAAAIPATVSVIGFRYFIRDTDKFAPAPRKEGAWWWKILLMLFPGTWAISLNGSHLTDPTASDISARFAISRFQAEFLQAAAKPVLAVFFVTFFSLYAFMLLERRPNRRLRAAVVVAVYVVMAVVFVLVGRSAGDGYW